MPKGIKANKPVKEHTEHSHCKLPFKAPNFSLKLKQNKPFKSLKQILQAENYDLYPASTAHYLNIDAGPSLLPGKKYCDLYGHLCKYTDSKTGLRFCNPEEFAIVRSLTREHVEQYLSLRKALVVLK